MVVVIVLVIRLMMITAITISMCVVDGSESAVMAIIKTNLKNKVIDNEIISPDSMGNKKVNMFTKLTRNIGKIRVKKI